MEKVRSSACKADCSLFSLFFFYSAFLHPPLDIGDLKRSVLGLIGLNGRDLLERMYGSLRIKKMSRNHAAVR